MSDFEFSDKITITKKNSGQSIDLDQSKVHIRENQKGIMAVSYVAPIFEIMDIEDFFSDVIGSEKLSVDIGGSGEFTVAFRGLVDGKGKNFPQNIDHKIILMQVSKNLDYRQNMQVTGFSKFKLRDEISDDN
ncbi:hypothetical protein [uncultured Methanobrevibacter sp.]|uniref:hypothetical protein n=1 Tax=uncultured Methanobrevibacter sp. TaxID=253161 RepID=UPI002600BB94|nr:hypothetical protein [uncultured Methanobrevibacter sp.]